MGWSGGGLLLLFGSSVCFVANTILKGVIIAPRISSNVIADTAITVIANANKTNLAWCLKRIYYLVLVPD